MIKMWIIIITVMSVPFIYRYNQPDKIAGADAEGSLNNFVNFSIDSATAVDYDNVALSFYYHDSLALGHPVTIAGKESKLLLTTPTLLFQGDSNQTPFLIFPGETIGIKYAGSDSLQLFVKGNQQRTNELIFFRKLVQKTGNIYNAFKLNSYLEKVNTVEEIEAAEKTINTVKDDRLQFLTAYIKQSPTSDGFIELAVNSIKSKALNDSVLLYYNNREMLSRQNTYQNLISEKLKTLKNLSYEPFQIYLNACLTLVSIITTHTTYATIENNSDFIKVFNFADKYFSGVTKDFLLSNTMFKAHTNDVQISSEYLKKFNAICKNEGYKNIIASKFSEKKANIYTKSNDKLLFTDGKTLQDIQWLMSKYKGKVLLFDFWASWCFPCRREMPFFHSLKKEYEGKEIVFVSISSDVTINDWLRASKEENLENDYSFLLLNFDRSLFVKRYQINTIPRYMLVGRDGKIINEDAPRPSDPKLKQLIDANL